MNKWFASNDMSSNRLAFESESAVRRYWGVGHVEPPELSVLGQLRDKLGSWRMLDVGIDYTREMIESCSERFSNVHPTAALIVCDVRQLVFESGRFDSEHSTSSPVIRSNSSKRPDLPTSRCAPGTASNCRNRMRVTPGFRMMVVGIEMSLEIISPCLESLEARAALCHRCFPRARDAIARDTIDTGPGLSSIR